MKKFIGFVLLLMSSICLFGCSIGENIKETTYEEFITRVEESKENAPEIEFIKMNLLYNDMEVKISGKAKDIPLSTFGLPKLSDLKYAFQTYKNVKYFVGDYYKVISDEFEIRYNNYLLFTYGKGAQGENKVELSLEYTYKN